MPSCCTAEISCLQWEGSMKCYVSARTTMFTCVSRESILLPPIQRSWPSIGGTAETSRGTLQACFVPCSLCTIVTESRQALENRPGAQAGKPGSPGTRLINESVGVELTGTRLCIGLTLRAWH